MKIVPSLLDADRKFAKMKAQLAPLVKSKLIDGVHVDVMDGEFVENYTLDWLNAPLVAKLHSAFPSLFIEVHLMVHYPSRYFEGFVKAGASRIWVHVESIDNEKKLNAGMKKFKVEFGPVVNPETPTSALKGNLRRVLVMSVQPGKGGQKFMPIALKKIKQLRKRFPLMTISVDGGVDAHTIAKVKKAGASEAVCGTAVFKGNLVKNMETITRKGCGASEHVEKALSRYTRGQFIEMKKEDFLRELKKW